MKRITTWLQGEFWIAVFEGEKPEHLKPHLVGQLNDVLRLGFCYLENPDTVVRLLRESYPDYEVVLRQTETP